MSLSDRRTFLTIMAAGLAAGCGFAPVYGPGGTGTALRGRVDVAGPDTRQDFVLVARFEERLGRATTPIYRLDYATSVTSTGVGITGADDVTRANLAGSLDYILSDRATGATVLSGQVSTFTAYSTTGSPVATRAARRDAEDRLMVALADQTVSQLLVRAPSGS
jgi:LPS-assembly lipoprotein